MIPDIALAPMIDRTIRWSSINSGTGNLTGLSTIAELLEAEFSDLPGETRLVAPGEVQEVDAGGHFIDRPAGRHLVVRVRPNAERRVLLTGHMDTVYPAEDPFQTCEWLDGTTLRGPGVLDMKSGLAVMLSGLLAFEETSPRLGYDVLINSDEETGSASSVGLIADLAAGKAAALTFEPTLPEGHLARSRPASGNYTARIVGRAAHAGRNPHEGRNAVVAAADLGLRLAAASRPGMTFNPARIDGGGPNNVVPSLAVLRFNVRPRGPAEETSAASLIASAVRKVAEIHDVSIDLYGGIGRPAKPFAAGTASLAALVERAAADAGRTISWRDSGGVCDGNNIAAYGVPVIDTMGAAGEAIHSPQERLDVMSLVPAAATTAHVLRLIEDGELS